MRIVKAIRSISSSSKPRSATSPRIKLRPTPPSPLPWVPSTDHIHPHDVAVSQFFSMHRPLDVTSGAPQGEEVWGRKRTASGHAGLGISHVFTESASGMENDPNMRQLPSNVLSQLMPFRAPSAIDASSTGPQQGKQHSSTTVMQAGQFMQQAQMMQQDGHGQGPRISIVILKDEPSGNTVYFNEGQRQRIQQAEEGAMEATSVKRKRKLKMNKHKYEKRRKAQRALRRRLGQ